MERRNGWVAGVEVKVRDHSTFSKIEIYLLAPGMTERYPNYA